MRQEAGEPPVDTREAGADGRRWWALGVLALCVLISVSDLPVVSIALPAIGAELRATPAELQLVLAGFVLASASCTMLAPIVASRWGHRTTLLAGLVLFGVASALSAVARDAAFLIATRILMGLGAGVILPMNIAIIGRVFPEAQRRRAVGISVAGVAMAMPIGPIVGGLVIDRTWWGWIFVINVVAVAVAVPTCVRLLPGTPPAAGPRRNDPASMILIALGLSVLACAVIAWNGDPPAWLPVGLAVAGVVLLALFGARQRRADAAAIGPAPFRDRNYRWAQLTLTVGHFAWTGALLTAAVYLQEALHLSAFAVGLRLVPLAVMGLVGSLAAERLTRRFGARPLVASALVTFAAGVWLMSYVTTSAGATVVIFALALVGFGGGLPQSPALAAAMGALPTTAAAGQGQGFINGLRHFGGGLGIAFVGTVAGPYVPIDAFAGHTAIAMRVTALVVAGVALVAALTPHDNR